MSLNKQELFNTCLDVVNERITRYEEKMESISGSAAENEMAPNFDEFGNKGELLTTYEETAAHLDRAREMKETLANLDRAHYSEMVGLGSVVETNTHYFYVSVPLGEISMEDGSEVYAISTEAPIYKQLEGKKAGAVFTHNNEEIKVIKVF